MKVYEPKLSKTILKSCKGCAQMQKLITAEGYKRNVHEIAMNCSMFNNENGVQRCQLGYANYGIGPIVPLERCPKPKTRNEFYICGMFQRYGKLNGSTYFIECETK